MSWALRFFRKATLTGWSLTRARGAAIAVDDAAEQDFALGIEAVFGEQSECGVAVRHGEGRRDHGLFGAGADQPGIGAGAQSEAEAVEQDGFAGAGLAGQGREAGGEMQIEPLDQHDIADREAVQHEGVLGCAGL